MSKELHYVDQNFCVIDNLEGLSSISNVGTFRFENQWLIPQLKLSLQGITITGSKSNIKIISRWMLMLHTITTHNCCAKGIESLPQSLIFQYLYLCNPMS